MHKTTLAALGFLTLVGCGTVPMPINVSTAAVDSVDYVDTADFSYQTDIPADYSALKLCIAENVVNSAVTLQDGVGSHFGPFTGLYYINGNSQSVGGGPAFKYVDDLLFTLVASGTADAGPVAWGITRDLVRFDLKAAIDGPIVTLKFINISRAQQNTGAIANDGFRPVGTWTAARPLQIVDALAAVAYKIRHCLDVPGG